MDVLVGILRLQKEELGDDQIRPRVVDGRSDEDDPVLEQPREDVVGPLAAARCSTTMGTRYILPPPASRPVGRRGDVTPQYYAGLIRWYASEIVACAIKKIERLFAPGCGP